MKRRAILIWRGVRSLSGAKILSGVKIIDGVVPQGSIGGKRVREELVPCNFTSWTEKDCVVQGFIRAYSTRTAGRLARCEPGRVGGEVAAMASHLAETVTCKAINAHKAVGFD